MFDTNNTILVVIDVQGKLAGLVKESSTVIHNIQKLIHAAGIFEIPVIYTEQMPEKIGPTIDLIKSQLEDYDHIEKSSFSCMGESSFQELLADYDRDQIIVCGIETHVCVYQTAFDLIQANYQVKAVKNAISARHTIDHTTALDLMKQAGAVLTTTETIICELLKTAEHENFKEIIKLIK